MTHRIKEQDEGKTVVDHNGEKLGTISEVEKGIAYIIPNPGLTDRLKAKLGWGDRGPESFPLQEELVDDITNDEIILQSPQPEDRTHVSGDERIDPGRPSGVESHAVGLDSEAAAGAPHGPTDDPDANAGPVEEMREHPKDDDGVDDEEEIEPG